MQLRVLYTYRRIAERKRERNWRDSALQSATARMFYLYINILYRMIHQTCSTPIFFIYLLINLLKFRFMELYVLYIMFQLFRFLYHNIRNVISRYEFNFFFQMNIDNFYIKLLNRWIFWKFSWIYLIKIRIILVLKCTLNIFMSTNNSSLYKWFYKNIN